MSDINPSPSLGAAGDEPANGGVSAPSQQAPEPQTTTPTPALAPSFDELVASMDQEKLRSMSSEDIDGLLSGDADTVGRFLPAAKAPPEPEDKSKAVTPIEPATPAGAEKGVRRMYLGGINPAEQVRLATIATAMKGGKTLEQAITEMGLVKPAEAPKGTEAGDEPDPAATPAPPGPDVAPEVRALNEQIAELQEQRRAAKAAYEDTDELTEQIALLKVDLREAEKAAKSQAVTAQTFAQLEAENRIEAEDKFGELLETDPAFKRAVSRERAYAESIDDPIFNSPDWPMKLLERVHEEYAGKPGHATTSAPLQRPAVPAVENRPKGAVAAPSGAAAVVSEEEALRMLENMSLEEVNATMDELGRRGRR